MKEINEYQIVRSPLAEFDIAEIWEYTTRKWSIDKANQYIRDLDIKIQTLKQSPHIYSSNIYVDDYEIRFFNYQSHYVFYRIIEHTVHIIRVLHVSRDWENILS